MGIQYSRIYGSRVQNTAQSLAATVHVTDQFVGTNLNAIFGAVVLDLRDAIITGI